MHKRSYDHSRRMTAAAELLPHDRICDWEHELDRLAPLFPSLPASARRAVTQVIESFLREDGRGAGRAGDLLAALDPATALPLGHSEERGVVTPFPLGRGRSR
jgi:hypothetical protein